MCCTGVQGRGPPCYTASSVSAETCTLIMFMQVNIESCVALEHVPNMLYFVEHLRTTLRRTAQHLGQAQVRCFARSWLVLFAPFGAVMYLFYNGPKRRHAASRSTPAKRRCAALHEFGLCCLCRLKQSCVHFIEDLRGAMHCTAQHPSQGADSLLCGSALCAQEHFWCTAST